MVRFISRFCVGRTGRSGCVNGRWNSRCEEKIISLQAPMERVFSLINLSWNTFIAFYFPLISFTLQSQAHLKQKP